MRVRKKVLLFLGGVACFLICLSFLIVPALSLLDPAFYLYEKMLWEISIQNPYLLGFPSMKGIHIQVGIQYPEKEFERETPAVSVWAVNSSGLFLNGTKVESPWVNCSFSVREGIVIVGDTVGGTVGGYVDINVSNPSLLEYLLKDPTSALMVLDNSTQPLTYYVYAVNTSYIIYRVILNNVTDGPHIIWVYAGGNYTGLGYPGIPFEITYSGPDLYNYTAVENGIWHFFVNGSPLKVYQENGETYIFFPVLKNGTFILYGRMESGSDLSLKDISVWYDDFETFTGWVNYSLGNLYWSSTYKYAGNYGIVKNDNNDPNGGYKQLPFTLGSKPFVLEAEIKRINTLGGAVDRIGVINGTGYGYGFAFDNGISYLEIDKRSAYAATVLSSGVSAKPSGWYLARMYWFPNGTIVTEIVQDGKVLKSLKVTDTSYSSFDYVYIFGGYEYAVDNMRIRFISPSGEITPRISFNESPLPTIYGPVETAPESVPETCTSPTTTTINSGVTTTTTTTRAGGGGGYIPPSTSTPIITWVDTQNGIWGEEGSENGGRMLGGVLGRIEEVSKEVGAFILRNPEVGFIIIIMILGLVLLVVGSRKR